MESLKTERTAATSEPISELEELKAAYELLKERLAARDKQVEYLETQVGVDFLTGTNSRLIFENELNQSIKIMSGEIKEHREGVEPLKEISLVFIDLDNFKQVNDTLGHPAGDGVLKKTAELFRHTLRGTDMLARYGGDEFVALLPGTTEENAIIVANKFKTALEDNPELKKLGITASMGVSSANASNGIDSETLIKYADNAAYQAKHSGRNRVEVYKHNAA